MDDQKEINTVVAKKSYYCFGRNKGENKGNDKLFVSQFGTCWIQTFINKVFEWVDKSSNKTKKNIMNV